MEGRDSTPYCITEVQGLCRKSALAILASAYLRFFRAELQNANAARELARKAAVIAGQLLQQFGAFGIARVRTPERHFRWDVRRGAGLHALIQEFGFQV